MTFETNNELLINLSVKNHLDLDKVIAGYLVAGDEFLILLNIFEGQTLNIPSSRKLNAPCLQNIHLIEDDERKYKDYVKSNIIDYNDKEYKVINVERKILNHWYIPVVEVV